MKKHTLSEFGLGISECFVVALAFVVLSMLLRN